MDSKLYGAGNVAKTTLLLAGIGGLLVGHRLPPRRGRRRGDRPASSAWASAASPTGRATSLAVRAAGAVPISEAEAPDLHAGGRRDRPAGRHPEAAGVPHRLAPAQRLRHRAQPRARGGGASPAASIDMCDRDELMGVIAHEVGHIRHRDILIGSVAAAIATAISFVANMAMWAGMFGGGDDDDGPSPVAVIAIALTAPIAAGLLQMALSRSREFEADRAGAELHGRSRAAGPGAAQARRRRGPHPGRRDAVAGQRLHREPAPRSPRGPHRPAGRGAPVNQANRVGGATKWFTTHPPIEERVARLRALRVDPVR